ncbi:MAG: DUF3048 domain-containing protein [Firmicutes bacterium]|jgi:hypothetical protein|nr:DUF3048 domain-containing protein [Bacillota bacterium]
MVRRRSRPQSALLFAGFFVVVVALLVVAQGLRDREQAHPVVDQFGQEETVAGTPTSPTPPPRDPLNGSELAPGEEREYYAVVIENSSAARPHRGLAGASIVYEMLAEGGITRFLALYSGHGDTPVGPIRSVRPYIVDIAAEHGVMLVHCGGSTDALSMISRMRYPALDEIKNPSGFYRDRLRSAPHNLFGTPETFLSLAARKGVLTTSARSGMVYALSPGPETVGTDDVPTLRVEYNRSYRVEWEYDADTRTYGRFMNGKPHFDPDTNRQLRADNLVVQFVPTRVIDSEGRLAMDLSGPGDAIVSVGGMVQRVRWARQEGQTTSYTRESGDPVEFVPGTTWVQIVPVGTRVIGIGEE